MPGKHTAQMEEELVFVVLRCDDGAVFSFVFLDIADYYTFDEITYSSPIGFRKVLYLGIHGII